MGLPGEIPQEIGRAYAKVLVGCLEIVVKGFERQFDVQTSPHKLTFAAGSGVEFSFDAIGRLKREPYNCEVLLETKGYRDGTNLMAEYKEFVAKAYVTSRNFSRHQDDLFWFVTNVPFATSIGRALTSGHFLYEALTENSNERIRSILGTTGVDRDAVINLSKRVFVCILTDSFIKVTGTCYTVEADDNIWTIVKSLHGNHIPSDFFDPIAVEIAKLNNLKDPNLIFPNQRLFIPWRGISWD